MGGLADLLLGICGSPPLRVLRGVAASLLNLAFCMYALVFPCRPSPTPRHTTPRPSSATFPRQYPRSLRGYSMNNGVLEISLDVDFDNFAFTPSFDTVVFRHDDEVFAMELDCTDGDADSDGICDELDSCPNSALNDGDGDGICFENDSCPNDPANGGVYAATCGIADNETLWHYLVDDGDSFEVIVADTTGGFDMFVVGTEGGAVYGVNISAPAVAQAAGNALPTTWAEFTANGVTEDGSLVRGTAYIVSDDYNIYALDGKDGTLHWRTHLTAVPDDISASPDGSIVVVHLPYGYDYRDNYLGYNTSTGELLWEYSTTTWYYSSNPVGITWSKVYPGRFYCNHGDSFGAINGFNGTVVWTAAVSAARRVFCCCECVRYLASHSHYWLSTLPCRPAQPSCC